jgi:hypothetical protein
MAAHSPVSLSCRWAALDRRQSVEDGLTLGAPPSRLAAAQGGVWYLVVVW